MANAPEMALQQAAMALWQCGWSFRRIAAEQVVLEFHKLDPTEQAFRYSRVKGGARHLESSPERVDLSTLSERRALSQTSWTPPTLASARARPAPF